MYPTFPEFRDPLTTPAPPATDSWEVVLTLVRATALVLALPIGLLALGGVFAMGGALFDALTPDPMLAVIAVAVAGGMLAQRRAARTRQAHDVRITLGPSVAPPMGVDLTALRAAEGTCACCAASIGASADVWRCGTCAAPQHSACADWMGRCAAFGCGTSRSYGVSLRSARGRPPAVA